MLTVLQYIQQMLMNFGDFYAVKIISTLTFVIFLLILLVRIVLNLLLAFLVWYYHKYKAYLFGNSSKKKKPKPKKKPPTNRPDKLLKDLEQEKKEQKELMLLERLNNAQNEAIELAAKQEKIVGIVKPVGKWTAKVLGDHMASLITIARSSNNGEGFWVNMVKAQGIMASGKERSGNKSREMGI